ncbi:penicillin-binding transpeptidase domain-containing protein [Escherichia coli]
MSRTAQRYAHKDFASAPYKIAAKSGTAQVFGLKANETYNAQKLPSVYVTTN